jgi:sugar phosphate isomerase/epimerase
MKRISIGSWAYAIGPYEENPVPWDEVCDKLKDLGFDGVELGGFGIHPNPDNHPTKEDREKMMDRVKGLGLGISGMVPNLWGEQLINTDDNSKYIAEFKRGLEFAVDVETKGIRVDTVQPPTIFDDGGRPGLLHLLGIRARLCLQQALRRRAHCRRSERRQLRRAVRHLSR